MLRISPAEAEKLVRRKLRGWGATEAVALCVARHLVESELMGHPSHGLRMILYYRDLVEAAECDVGAEPTLVSQEGSLATVDARAGLGHPAMVVAVDCAVEAARSHHVGVSAVIQCGHAGRLGAWAERGAAKGMATLVCLAAADPPFPMTAAPSAAPSLHTNPLAIAVPSGGRAFVLDMATSAIAAGKILVAHARGAGLPAGVIVDGEGKPSTDPADFLDGGALLPAAGHKGFALAAIIEALSICLTGGDAAGRSPLSGALVICVRADSFRPEREVRESIERLRERLHASARQSPVLAPGEFESLNRRADEIQIDRDVLDALAENARSSKQP